jgi:hypothetical protein
MLTLAIFAALDWFLLWPAPSGLYAVRALVPPVIDGRTDDDAWKRAHWSEAFVDITGDPSRPPRHRTTFAWVWDDSALTVAFRVEEPHVWATLTDRDAIIYHDNDVEVFFDPDGDNHAYGEVEVNALNTIFDLMLDRPYRDGGRADIPWNVDGLRSSVWVDGTLNDPSDIDRGWSVEMRLPWNGLKRVGGITGPPTEGTQWRVNASRVQWNTTAVNRAYVKSPGQREGNWVWAPQGKVDMHQPERWGVLEFVGERPMGRTPVDPLEAERRAVMEAYHAQKKFERIHRRWGLTEEELSSVLERRLNGFLRVDVTEEGWQVRLPLSSDAGGPEITVNQDSQLRMIRR